MMRQLVPTLVIPPPPSVPREMVTDSRITVSSPMTQAVGSPLYLRSCGAMPTEAKGKMRTRSPILVWPSRTTCEMSSQFSPSVTLGPMVQKGPTVQEAGMTAPSAMIELGWMGIELVRGLAGVMFGVLLLAGARDELAGDGCFGGDLAVDGADALHLDRAGAPVDDSDLDAELVAGDDGFAEAGFVDAGEDHELVVAVGDFGEQERTAGLRHGFDGHDAGHDGVVGEVAGELRLVGGDVFDGDDALLALHLDHAVDEQEGVAVREDGHDFDDVHRVVRRRRMCAVAVRGGICHGEGQDIKFGDWRQE